MRRFEIRIKRETDMGLIETASANSIWRGIDYYEARKVISWEKTGTFAYDGIVSGSEGNKYTVHIETNHPRRSTCNCPFAEGRRVVCKHMIALYFTAEPKAADEFLRQVEEWEAEEQERKKQHYEDLRKYVNQLSKAELRERLYDALVELEERDNYWR